MNDSGGDLATNLPTFSPDPALWPRVAAARRRQAVRGRRVRAGLALAAVMVLGLAIVPVTWQRHAPGHVATVQDESRALEDEWRRLAPPDVHAYGAGRVRAIDAALQTAYDRGADTDETRVLWQQRNRALRDLIANIHGDVPGDRELTRI